MEQPFPNELKHLYKEAESIGSGGFARVFRAKHRDGRIVAVKIPSKVLCNCGDSYNCFGALHIIIIGGSSGDV